MYYPVKKIRSIFKDNVWVKIWFMISICILLFFKCYRIRRSIENIKIFYKYDLKRNILCKTMKTCNFI